MLIDKIMLYPNNPRKISASAMALLKESIRRDPAFMRLRPIVVDKNGVILGGNQRYRAICELGMSEIPDEWVARADNLTDEQRRRFVIVDNAPEGMSGEWDTELLAVDWADLKLDSLGLEILEIGEKKGNCDPDEIPAEKENVISKVGDVWLLGQHRLMCGDCGQAKDVGVLLEGKKAGLCLTDPPYGLGDSETKKNKYYGYQDTVDNLQKLIRQFLPISLKYSDVLVLTPGNKNQGFYPTPDWTMGWFCPAGIGRGPWGFCCWQPILCYGKDPKLKSREGSYPDVFISPGSEEKKEIYPDAIIWQETSDVLGHPCSKPINFWSWLLRRCSGKKDNGLVYEPFCGSGTTIIACEQLNRKCFAMEIEPRYVDVSVRRWEKFTGKTAVLSK